MGTTRKTSTGKTDSISSEMLEKKLKKMVLAELNAGTSRPIQSAQKSLLVDAFEIFNQKTIHLQNAYNILKKQVVQMNKELDKKNRQLKSKVSELNNTKTYLHNLLESIPSGVIAAYLDGTVTTFNGIAAGITGISQEKILDKNIFAVDLPEGEMFTGLIHALEAGKLIVTEERGNKNRFREENTY